MRNMSLIEHAIRTTFSNLDDETKRRLIDEFTIDCYGIRITTISCIADQMLRRFANFIIKDENVMGKINTLDDLRMYFDRYRKLKDICVGGYFFSHYFSHGDNTYIYTEDTTFDKYTPSNNNEFIINTDPEEIDRRFVDKEKFFQKIEQKDVRKTIIALQNFKLYPEINHAKDTYITLSSYLLSDAQK